MRESRFWFYVFIYFYPYIYICTFCNSLIRKNDNLLVEPEGRFDVLGF